MRTRFAITMTAMSVALAAPGSAQTKAAFDAWQRGDYRTAVDQWQVPADAGDADAQFNLAQAYKLGRGVPVDTKKAEEYYRRAAAQGHVLAQDNYGLALFQNGKPRDAIPYLEKSAARGEPRAQYILGTMLFNGVDAPKDWVRAYALTTRAVQSGLPQAAQSLAQMDGYLSAADRQQGLALARTMAAGTGSGELSMPMAGTGTATTGPGRATGPGVRRVDLPPSYVDARPPSYPAPHGVAARANETPPSPEHRAPAPPSSFASLGPQARPKPTRDASPMGPAVDQPAAPRAPVAGRWRVQLGAFGEAGNARKLWSSVAARFPGRSVDYVRAGALTRVLVGPYANRAEAQAACRGATPCVPVGP